MILIKIYFLNILSSRTRIYVTPHYEVTTVNHYIFLFFPRKGKRIMLHVNNFVLKLLLMTIFCQQICIFFCESNLQIFVKFPQEVTHVRPLVCADCRESVPTSCNPVCQHKFHFINCRSQGQTTLQPVSRRRLPPPPAVQQAATRILLLVYCCLHTKL